MSCQCDIQIRSSDARTRSNACCKCGVVGYFHGDCDMFNAQTQSGDNVYDKIGQMTHPLTTKPTITDMVFKSILKN